MPNLSAIMNEVNTTKKKTGRKPAVINFPDNTFTVKDLQKSTDLSKITIYAKIEEALTAQVIEPCGKESNTKGRPSIFYRKKVSPQSNAVAPTAPVAQPVVPTAS